MERKKHSKGSGWECCYANKIFGTFGVEMRACGQKLVKFCTLTHAAKLLVEIVFRSIIGPNYNYTPGRNSREIDTHFITWRTT